MFRKKAKVLDGVLVQIMRPGTYRTSAGAVLLTDDSHPWVLSEEMAKELKRAGAVRYIRPHDIPSTYRNL